VKKKVFKSRLGLCLLVALLFTLTAAFVAAGPPEDAGPHEHSNPPKPIPPHSDYTEELIKRYEKATSLEEQIQVLDSAEDPDKLIEELNKLDSKGKLSLNYEPSIEEISEEEYQKWLDWFGNYKEESQHFRGEGEKKRELDLEQHRKIEAIFLTAEGKDKKHIFEDIKDTKLKDLTLSDFASLSEDIKLEKLQQRTATLNNNEWPTPLPGDVLVTDIPKTVYNHGHAALVQNSTETIEIFGTDTVLKRGNCIDDNWYEAYEFDGTIQIAHLRYVDRTVGDALDAVFWEKYRTEPTGGPIEYCFLKNVYEKENTYCSKSPWQAWNYGADERIAEPSWTPIGPNHVWPEGLYFSDDMDVLKSNIKEW